MYQWSKGEKSQGNNKTQINLANLKIWVLAFVRFGIQTAIFLSAISNRTRTVWMRDIFNLIFCFESY